MRVKNKDIAKALGISCAAVSLAINNRPGVSEKTRSLVMSFLLNNSLQVNPQIEVSNENRPIIFAVHKKHGEIINEKPFFSDLIATIQQEAMAQSYPLLLINYMPENDLNSYMQTLENTVAAGIIVLATEMDLIDLQYYKNLNKPVLLLDSSFELEHFNAVTINNKDAVFQAVKYAYDLGHRNIGYLKSSVMINNFEHRFDGYKSALHHFQIEANNNPVLFLHPSSDQTYHDMKRILKHKSEELKLPSIFIADLDYIALGAMRALKECGYTVPDDISIIGFDDIASCKVVNPRLTSIRVNRLDIGKIAVKRLIEMIRQPSSYYSITQISTDLVVRESTKRVAN